MSCGCASETALTATTAPAINVVAAPTPEVSGLRGMRGMRGLRGLGDFQQRAWRDENWLATNTNFRAMEPGNQPPAPAPSEVVPGVSNTTLAVGGIGTIAALAAAYFAAKKFKIF